mmetsp:Transcript_59815/g.177668  ORF Transcript_59815/g.177668 Transcript_59815/m.177668 type:complete len:317 (-) Transcript_59815:222-1172(-)
MQLIHNHQNRVAPEASETGEAAPLAPAPPAVKRIFKVTPSLEFSSLIKLLATPVDACIITPKLYFQASNELTVVTLVACWTITLAYDYKLAWDHPARNYVGHLNPCFGWDFAPASYVAVFMCAADVYLAWTYAVLEALRTRLRDTDNRIDRAERFSLVTTYLHGIASMMWLLLWLVGPPDGRWEVHLAIFSAALGFRYLCTLGNYVENRFGKAFEKGHVNTSHTLFIIVYGLVVAVLPVLYFVDITVYAAEGRTGIDPPLPWQLLQTFDILWMGCLSASTAMSVPEPPISKLTPVTSPRSLSTNPPRSACPDGLTR